MNWSRTFFNQSVGILTIGTLIAQGIGYLVAPIVSRLYSPADMGELAMYMRIVGLGAVIATARYEMAIPIVKSDYHSAILTRLTLRIVGVSTLVMLLVSLVWLLLVAQHLVQDGIWLLLCGTSIVFLALSNIGVNWATRAAKFSQITSSRIYQSIGTHSFRLLFGWLNWGGFGLILGTTIGFLIGLFSFRGMTKLFHKFGTNPKGNSRSIVLARQNKDFPFVSLPHAVMELAKDVIVALMIIYFFSQELFGSFSYAYTMLRLPLLVVGTSIGQVFFKSLTDLKHQGGAIYPSVKRLVIFLVGFSLLPFLVLQLYGQELFGFVFGEVWETAGSMAEIMSMWLLLNFISSPISTLPMVLNKQRPFFWLGFVMTVSQLIGFGILPFYIGSSSADFFLILTWISMIQAVLLVVYIGMSIHFAKAADLAK